jgi:predicted amidohydrolase
MVFEYDPEWPLRYFNTSIIVSPEGEVILRYRKLQCADLNGLLNITTPGSIFTRYVERYGYDALVPVVDTPIGRLGSLICYDANWPELWRALALKGAEVICNPTSEIHSDRRPHWYAAKRAHAAENRVYVASANAGSEQFRPGAPVTGMNRGHSALIDYNGALAAHADGPGVVPLLGRIDLGALRRARARAAGRVGAFRPEAVAEAYATFQGFPLDCFLERPMMVPGEGPPLVRAQIERLIERGVYQRP